MKKLSKKARMSTPRTYVLSDAATKIEAQLVDIDFYPRMSEETLAFNATLHLSDGTRSCTYDCRNDGRGGCTDIRPCHSESDPTYVSVSKELLRKWNEHLNTQRDDVYYATAEELGWTIPSDSVITKSAESEVSNMLAEWCDQHNL